jgi:hypothetical protein
LIPNPEGTVKLSNFHFDFSSLREFSLTVAMREPAPSSTVRAAAKEYVVPALTAEFLRRQADNCVRVARQCFDLTASERLRIMAAELRAKADELDEEDDPKMPPQMIQRNGSSSGEPDHG